MGLSMTAIWLTLFSKLRALQISDPKGTNFRLGLGRWIRHGFPSPSFVKFWGVKPLTARSLKWGLNDCDRARTTRSPQPARYEGRHRRDQGWSIIERQRQIFSWPGSVTRAVRDGQYHFAAAGTCRWVRRFPPGPGRPPSWLPF